MRPHDGEANTITTETRLAQNEAMFRAANERIEAVATRLTIIQRLPFICECGRRDCSTIVRALAQDYERVRAHATHFLYAPGHEEGMPGSRVVETLEGAVIVQKVGEAGRVAVATDPRRNGR